MASAAIVRASPETTGGGLHRTSSTSVVAFRGSSGPKWAPKESPHGDLIETEGDEIARDEFETALAKSLTSVTGLTGPTALVERAF